MFDTLLFLFLRALPLSLAAECGTKPLTDITDNSTFEARNYQENWWTAREALCSQTDPCFDGNTDCTVRVAINLASTLALSRSGPKENPKFEKCWNGTADIIEQCVKEAGVADGSWTLPEGVFKYGIEKTEPIPDIGGAALVDKTLPSARFEFSAPAPTNLPPKPSFDDAYNVVCDVGGFKGWGFSGWAWGDQINDPKQANTKGSGYSAFGDCHRTPDGHENEGFAFQGCDTYRLYTFKREDCTGGRANKEGEDWSYAIYGPGWLPERIVGPYRSWRVLAGEPQVAPEPET
ncbi:hypothetical protein HYALB_00001162 [Hymenoscyphus albidus]|uniref:Uncharacterized protein n=1 Tax=Hymenoscyphus albidus TaxID=595503 RepID=A0A9N9LH37_9HELO|nr:hypothetical protein HYALB_00001162 [Hymenoscyphus albidus]